MKQKASSTLTLLLAMYLGLCGKYLAIYHNNETKPMTVLPYDVSLFCEADRHALNRGIPFSSDAELNKLLEDYTS